MINTEIAKSLFQAFEDGDNEAVRRLCAADFQATQNGGPPIDLTTVLAFSSAVQSVVTDFRYETPKRSATPGGFVEEHDVCGTLPDGTSIRLAVCVVAEVEAGKITRLREYFDSAAAAGLATHLGAT